MFVLQNHGGDITTLHLAGPARRADSRLRGDQTTVNPRHTKTRIHSLHDQIHIRVLKSFQIQIDGRINSALRNARQTRRHLLFFTCGKTYHSTLPWELTTKTTLARDMISQPNNPYKKCGFAVEILLGPGTREFSREETQIGRRSTKLQNYKSYKTYLSDEWIKRLLCSPWFLKFISKHGKGR